MYMSSPVGLRPLLIFGLVTALFVTIYRLCDTSRVTSMLYAPSHRPHYYVPPAPAEVLLVSAFYPLEHSKHSSSEYDIWLKGFLGTVETHVYFFTSPDMEDRIRSLRGNLPITVNTTFPTALSVPPLVGVEDRYEKMHAMDPEKDIHNYHLYAVWSSKAYFLDQGVKNCIAAGHNYDYAFWNDAGSFRDGQEFFRWPNGRRISEIFDEGNRLTGTPKEDLFFQPIWDSHAKELKKWQESDGPVEAGHTVSEGSFFGGSPKAIQWWTQTYYAYHDYWLFQKDYFVGKDQVVFSALFLMFPERFITVWQYDGSAPEHIGSQEGPLGACGGTWWYYQWFVAGTLERDHMRNVWWNPAEHVMSRGWFFWRSKNKSCRLTRLLSMEDVLKRTFGRGWKPPHTTIDVTVSQRG